MNDTATLLQVNLQNLFFDARDRGQKIDFEKIWQHFTSREAEFLTEALAYTTKSDNFDSQKFEIKLQNIGYTIKFKDIKPGYKLPNHNVSITLDCMDRIDRFNKWIIISGDDDLSVLAKYLRSKGKKVEVWGFKESGNSLEGYADKIHFIDEDFYYNKPRISVFGINYPPTKLGNQNENH